MNSNQLSNNAEHDNHKSLMSLPAKIEYHRTVSQDLRYLDDALTHAIDQLTQFSSETLRDLSLKYELIRNNESRVIGLFARQLMLLNKPKEIGENDVFYNEYAKLERFLLAININKISIDYIVQHLTFDDLLNGKTNVYEKVFHDAQTTETERKDFHNALNALKDCIEYFSNGGTNDNGRFYWHTKTPPPPPPSTTKTQISARQHRLSDTAVSIPTSPDSGRSTSVCSSISTEFQPTTNSNNPLSIIPPSQIKRINLARTPPPSRSSHLCVNGKGKCEHPSKKSSVDPSIFANLIPPRNIDLQLPDGGLSSRRSSYGSDTESRLPSGSATPKSPTIRSPTMSASPMGSAYNSDVENDPKSPDTPIYNSQPSFLKHRIAHKIQHKWSNLLKLSTCNACPRRIFFLGVKCNVCKFDRTRVFKFSFCDVCRKQLFRGKSCLYCKYKCHKECVQHAPANCGFSEGKLRRVIDNVDIQNALANSTPLSRKYHFNTSESISPASLTPISAPGSPAPTLSLSGYNFNSTALNSNSNISVTESIYCTQNDPDSWVVIETNNKISSEIPESPCDTEASSLVQTDPRQNSLDLSAKQNRLIRQVSQSEPAQYNRDDFKSNLSISFDDDESDPEKRSLNLSTFIQDWVIAFNNIKIIEEVRRSSGSLMKAHWHGEIAVRLIKPDSNKSEIEFVNQFKNQIFRLRKVRHEHLNLYTGVCIESPNYAIASSWIRGASLFEIIHIRNDIIQFNLAVHYAAQIAQAMSYLHEKSINHMSLRTTNIFVQNNRIVLTDYGLAPLSKCYRYTEQPAIIAPRGWLSYLPPELIRKLDPRDKEALSQQTPQTDVYAFGTVWYELLFREFPFAKQPPEYIIWRAGNSIKQPLSSVHISKNAKDIINQCWSYEPDDRPDFAMLCKSLSKMPGKRAALVRSPSTPLQHHGHQILNHAFN